jgi:acetate kinase
MRLLVFNAGSSSLKFELTDRIAAAPVRRIAVGSFADTDGSGLFRWSAGSSNGGHPLPARTLADAAGLALDWLLSIHGRNLLGGLDATAHRIVHGGGQFRETTLLNDAELAALTGLMVLAPLHNPPALAVIESVRRRLGVERPSSGNGSFRASIMAPRAAGSGRSEPAAPERRANANYRP